MGDAEKAISHRLEKAQLTIHPHRAMSRVSLVRPERTSELGPYHRPWSRQLVREILGTASDVIPMQRVWQAQEVTV